MRFNFSFWIFLAVGLESAEKPQHNRRNMILCEHAEHQAKKKRKTIVTGTVSERGWVKCYGDRSAGVVVCQ